jgi:hypothetical protein
MRCTGIYGVVHHGDVEPTIDMFRALARSSPWRWRTLHFSHRDGQGEVEAWLRRPGELLVRPATGAEEYVTGVPYTVLRAAIRSTPDGNVPMDPWLDRDRDPRPVFRPDGLVAERPQDWYLEYGDPMWRSYTWTAMLDPDELSHHVDVADLRVGEHHGREVWSARLRAVEGYEPRCGCCPLLWSEISARAEYADEPERLERFAAEGYPTAYDVALDVQTGVVLRCHPVGGDADAPWLDNDILEVDADLDEVFAGRSVIP